VDNPGSWERDYREALRRDPGLDPARLGLAETLRHLHRNAEADEEYRRYLVNHPDDSDALVGTARNAVELGDLERAAELLDRALALTPASTSALRARADVDLHRGDLRSAIGWLDQAIRADPFDHEALHVRAGVRARLGDQSGSRADIDVLDRLKRDQAELLKLRERILGEPHNSDLKCRVAAWMFAHGRDQDGLGWAMAALTNQPNHPVTCRLLADYYALHPGQAGLANYYRLKAEQETAAAAP
jgi:tetratricopeptide (TPR) repeat protein